jgi:hypothetical protein
MRRTVQGDKHKIRGQQLSWAGECPWTKSLCFGSEEGRLIIPPIVDHPVVSDAVNGVDFVGDHVGVTSRSDVFVGYRNIAKGRIDACIHSFKGGAHGIVASSQNAFLAPIGVDGLLMLNIEAGREITVLIAKPRATPLNFYRLARLGTRPVGEVFACASRGTGLLAMVFANGGLGGPLIGHHFSGHDIVDVCCLNDPEFPFAVACLSRNREIFFLRDVMENQTPTALKLDQLEGTAYTLLSAKGHMFLLTDKEFIVLPDLARRFLRDETHVEEIQIRTMPTEATEVFLHNGESVLLLEDSIAVEYEVAELLGGVASTNTITRNAPSASFDAGWDGLVNLEMVLSPVS